MGAREISEDRSDQWQKLQEADIDPCLDPGHFSVVKLFKNGTNCLQAEAGKQFTRNAQGKEKFGIVELSTIRDLETSQRS